MSDTPYKVTVEEFDSEGNLVKRTVTEYIRFATGGVTKSPRIPNPSVTSQVYPYDGTYLVNTREGGE